ncbi:LolA family protein [Aliidiomarina sp. Khilg15.8]
MLRILFITCLGLFGMTAASAQDITDDEVQARLQSWHALSGTFAFEQVRELAGFSRPLRSRGELIIEPDSLHWNTQHPIATSLHIDAAGVHQIKNGERTSIEGSAFVGQVLLAMLQQDYDFISEHFKTAVRDDCIDLRPRESYMRDHYQQIALCGDDQLQRIEMREADDSETYISLQEVIDA